MVILLCAPLTCQATVQRMKTARPVEYQSSGSVEPSQLGPKLNNWNHRSLSTHNQSHPGRDSTMKKNISHEPCGQGCRPGLRKHGCRTVVSSPAVLGIYARQLWLHIPLIRKSAPPGGGWGMGMEQMRKRAMAIPNIHETTKWRFTKMGAPLKMRNQIMLVLKPIVTWGSITFRTHQMTQMAETMEKVDLLSERCLNQAAQQ